MPRLRRTSRDSELTHSQLQGGSFHCKMCRRAVWAGHNPIAFPESFKNLLTLCFLQDVAKCAVYRQFWRDVFFYLVAGLGKFQISHVDAEGRTRRVNYRPLDPILNV